MRRPRRRLGLVQLALGGRPELDNLHPTGQGVGKPAQCQYLGRPGEQELARALIGVDGHLDRAEEFRSQLNLVDHHEAVVLDEACWIVPGGAQRSRVV
jgi:hypothetical protein